MGRHNDKSIREVLNEFISTNSRVSKGYHTKHIEEIWKEQMGPIISGYTSKILFRDGAMSVYLTSAPLKKELLHGKDKIIAIINETLGQELVKSVDIY